MVQKLLISLSLLIGISVYANEITLQWLESKPKTYARDFYILQYLKQDGVSSNDAMNALGLVNRMNNKLLYAYTSKLNHDESKAVTQCMRAKAKELVNNNADCIKVGLSLYKATTLDSLELDTVISKVKTPYPKFAKSLTLLNAPTLFPRLISSDVDTFYNIYIQTGKKFRQLKLNYKIPSRVIKKVQTDKRFKKLIHLIITDPKMNLAQQSFFNLDVKNLDSKSSFLVALNLISHQKETEALPYLDYSYQKAYFQSDKDKIWFWKYLLSKDENNLKELLKSWDINIYTLYAKQHFNEKFNNIIYTVTQKDAQPIKAYDVNDQFAWIQVIRDTKDLTKEKLDYYYDVFTLPPSNPHLTFLYEKYHRFKKFYYINPYEDLMKDYDKDRKILINSIARQESHFIPSSISVAYAQGVMQIMPFLSKAIAKKKNEDYDIFHMFKASYSIDYANIHLNSLEKEFKNPLFIAYAYNAGGGFTRRLLKSGFFKEGKYEPFLSMEKIPYSETKEYGKKVLTNYVIYYNYNHKKDIKLTTLLENLH